MPFPAVPLFPHDQGDREAQSDRPENEAFARVLQGIRKRWAVVLEALGVHGHRR